MVDPSPTWTPMVARARKLVAISIIGPFALYVVTIPTVALRDKSNPYGPNLAIITVVGMAVLFGVVGVWIYQGIRQIPTAWKPGCCFYGCFIAFFFLPMLFELKDDLRIVGADVAYALVAVAINTGIVLAGWLPARHAAHLVLGNLSSPDVVNSSLAIKFKARGKEDVAIRVTPDSLKVEVRPSMSSEVKRSYPLTDLAAVAVRTETSDGEYPVPGAKGKPPIKVTRGDVVVIELPDGELVFPVKDDAQRVKRFVEERCRAVVARG